ncbi:MAG: HNH nuclease family protein [Pseudomonadota bacterium]|nr:MAG: HNH nuclease family protein [Pseudomonadota bacterium]
MASKRSGPRRAGDPINSEKLDAIVARANKERDTRMQGYREQSLKLHPWVCGRCGRTFTRENLHELTVHHKDHNHDNNPPDGSNWENLCLYCHDAEHQRFAHLVRGWDPIQPPATPQAATQKPFANLKDLLKGGS